MLRPPSLVLAAALLAEPAFAQTMDGGRAGAAPAPAGGPPSAEAAPHAHPGQRSPGPQVDRGPDTPKANAAHRGGGAVLEGAPGAPAPPPQPTPPLPAPSRQGG